MQMKVSQFNIGDYVDGFYIIGSVAKRNCVSGEYLTGKIIDKSGSINIIAWQYAGDVTANDNNRIVKVSGLIGGYNGQLQITADVLRLVTDTDQYDAADIVPSAPISVDSMMIYIKNVINTLSDADYKSLCKAMLNKYYDKFFSIPAAAFVHDAVLHGLAHHTFKMLESAERIADIYADHIDRNLLIAGVILHDIGKIKEFELSETGLVKDYTKEGAAIGHSVLGANLVSEEARALGFSPEKILLITNILYSHHGKGEYGAAAKPATLEALLVHLIDEMDAKVTTGIEGSVNTPAGEFSPKIFGLDNNRIYCHIA